MIYTVTFNPALDYVVRMDGDLLPGMTNRSSSEEYYFGGKGINVSMVLSELGLKSTALGFIAGFTGHAIDAGVKAAGIDTDFIELKEGISRINVKLKATEETEINAQGPKIDEAAQLELFNKLLCMYYTVCNVLSLAIINVINHGKCCSSCIDVHKIIVLYKPCCIFADAIFFSYIFASLCLYRVLFGVYIQSGYCSSTSKYLHQLLRTIECIDVSSYGSC